MGNISLYVQQSDYRGRGSQEAAAELTQRIRLVAEMLPCPLARLVGAMLLLITQQASLYETVWPGTCCCQEGRKSLIPNGRA